MRTRFSTARSVATGMVVLAALAACAAPALAHPLGNFTVNHFTALTADRALIRVKYVVDMAEIAAFQELQSVDADGDGNTSDAEIAAYGARVSDAYLAGLRLSVGGEPIALRPVSHGVERLAGVGGMSTLRGEFVYDGALPATSDTARVEFHDENHPDRIGWREIAVSSTGGERVFDSSAFANSASEELRNYPTDLLAAPLEERAATFSLASGAIPEGGKPLSTRAGVAVESSRDRLAELISVRELTPGAALFGLLVAAILGGIHAMSPGHGKTVVGAYLVGSRGTAKHAAFLGATVTITHTAAVFALGFITLFASNYVLPERLFPILSLVSGAIVVVIGLRLFASRLHHARAGEAHGHDHPHDEDHGHSHDGDHDHAHSHGAVHSHGGVPHSHLPPGADGRPVTWGSLLSLGISGGLLPCPSALVVLLSAISLHRVGYGLLLIVAFSAGLATVLTLVGLAFVYARDRVKIPGDGSRLVRFLPAASALVITFAGLAIVYGALVQGGYLPAGLGAAAAALLGVST